MSAIETIYRAERGRVLASLIRLLGGFDLAEEALHEAFAAAALQWPREGVPKNPRAWLVSAGRFKAIDKLRRAGRLREATAQLSLLAEEADMPAEPQTIADDTLRLIFTCCHPELTPDAQLALMLREVCGLTTEEIAAAYLVKPTTIAQRIVRAKGRIRELALPYEVPEAEDLLPRLEVALEAIYLVFTEAYAASSGPALHRSDLAHEALRLARLVAELMPIGDTAGLLALVLLQHARRDARLSASGEIVLLPDQDRSHWHAGEIAEGLAQLERALADPPLSHLTIQAAIAAVHMRAATAADTDWAEIVRLYDLLAIAAPSPVVALNRAVAIAMRDGPQAGLELLEPLARGELAGYRYAHAARADLLRRLGRIDEARLSYGEALRLSSQEVEQRFLRGRIAALG